MRRSQDDIFLGGHQCWQDDDPLLPVVTVHYLEVTLNNVQRALKLMVGRDGGRNQGADCELLRLLATPKKVGLQAKPKAMKNAQRPMASEDRSPKTVIHDAPANAAVNFRMCPPMHPVRTNIKLSPDAIKSNPARCASLWTSRRSDNMQRWSLISE